MAERSDRILRPLRVVAALSVVVVLGGVGRLMYQQYWVRRADGQVKQARQALARSDAETAERMLREALRHVPGQVAARRALGELLLAQGRLEEAGPELRQAAQRAPSEPHLLCRLAEAELRSGRLSLLNAAAEDGARAAALEPTCFRAQKTAADALIAVGDSRRGVDFLYRAVAVRPDDSQLRLDLQQQLLGAQRLREATEVALEITRRHPQLAQGYAVLGLCYQFYPPGTPEARTAPGVLARAIDLDPRNVVGHAQLGHHYLMRGEVARALLHLEAAHKLQPVRASVLFDLSRAYRKVGRRMEANAMLQRFRRVSDLQARITGISKRRVHEPDNSQLTQEFQALGQELRKLEVMAAQTQLDADSHRRTPDVVRESLP